MKLLISNNIDTSNKTNMTESKGENKKPVKKKIRNISENFE